MFPSSGKQFYYLVICSHLNNFILLLPMWWQVLTSESSWSWSYGTLIQSYLCKSVPITTNIVNYNPAHGEVYSLQHYTIIFSVENGVNHPNPDPEMLIFMLQCNSTFTSCRLLTKLCACILTCITVEQTNSAYKTMFHAYFLPFALFMVYLCYLYLFTHTGVQHDFNITWHTCRLTVTLMKRGLVPLWRASICPCNLLVCVVKSIIVCV